jgi:5-methylthioadenosine/S-adenosylhomocysteine deaminase
LLNELRHIARHHPHIAPDTILNMGTLAGAQALGLSDRLGSITPGKLARLAVVPLESPVPSPVDGVLNSTASAAIVTT